METLHSTHSTEGEFNLTDLENEIAENDELRRTFKGGCIEISRDVASNVMITSILYSVRNYDSFAEHNNEQDNHAFGLFQVEEDWIFWEISKCRKSEPQDCRCSLKKVLKIYDSYEIENSEPHGSLTASKVKKL
jgi:hypothetical protein